MRIKKSKQKSKSDSIVTPAAESPPKYNYHIGTTSLQRVPQLFNTTTTTVSLSEQPVKGTKKAVAGRKYKGTIAFLSKDNAEYLYLSNSYIARGIDTESEAIVRNGISVRPNNTADQQYIDLILKNNNFLLLGRDINTSLELYGQQMVEMFSDKETKTTRFELLPPTEMDYLRDKSNNVLYDKKTGEPSGYVQKRDGKEIATWTGNDAKRIIVFKYKTLGGYIEGIPGIQAVLYPAAEYGHIRSSVSDSFIRSLPVCHITATDATPGDIDEITNAVGKKFTAETVYVTSDRVVLENTGPSNDIDVFKFVEPTLSEIAACFHMPIEMLAATQYLQAIDFKDRYAEWLEHIKMKQRIIASTFEQKVFNTIFPDGVTVKFNSPATVNVTELITTVGFAMQSGAIDSDMAFEILAKNNIFGPFTDDIIAKRKSTGGVDNGMQDKKEEKVVDDNAVDTGDN